MSSMKKKSVSKTSGNRIITPKAFVRDLKKIVRDAAKGNKDIEGKLWELLAEHFISMPMNLSDKSEGKKHPRKSNKGDGA